MYGERKKSAFILVALLVASAAVLVAASSDDSSADVVPYFPQGDHISLQAGGSTNYRLDFTNDATYVEHSPTDNVYVKLKVTLVNSSGNDPGNVDTSVKVFDKDMKNTLPSPVRLEGGEISVFVVNISAERLAAHGDYTMTLTWAVEDYAGNPIPASSGTKTVTVNLNSDLSTSDNFNKFLGFIDNNLGGIFGQLWFTLLVTVIAWFIIGIAIMFIAVPLVTFLMTRKDDPDRPILRHSLIRQCLIIIVVFTIVNSLCIVGIDEKLMDPVKSLSHLIYLVVGLGIVWRIYRTFLDRMSEHMRGRDMIAGGEMQEFESFKPLFLYIGEIIIALIGIFSGLGMLGVDMAAIITSAGIVSLGITFGAQQVLSQFFSGLVILSTRPFKKGDLIQIAGNSIVYRVRRVNVMNTELENWDNSDITIVPNNSITSSHVKNITRDTLRTKVHLFMDVGYDTDIALARAAMIEVANANPRVIKDGSVSKPSTRLTDFADSNITLRLTVWVDDYNDHGSIGGELRVALFNKFNELGINIDYPQVVIHNGDPESPAATEKE